MPLCLAFGTGEGLLWYGICVPCSKRLPVVRDASSEALGAQKQASTVRKRYSVPKIASCGTRRIFKGPQNSRLHRLCTASCGTRRIFRGVPCQKQPPAAPDASSVRETAPALFVRSGGPFPCSFDGTRYQKRPPLGGEQT